MTRVRVLCEDSVAYLAGLPDGAVDCVITDPPYAEKTHAGARTSRGSDRAGVKLVSFASVDDDAFLTLCRQAVRVAKRWVVMTCDWRHAAVAEVAGLPVVRLGVWVKPDAMPQLTGDRPGTGWEAVLILHRPGKKRWNRGGHHGVWTCPVERNNDHPTQKPVRLLRSWIRDFTDPDEHVLDPYAGSGTTGVAAFLEGRRATLVEHDPRYAAVARRRVAALSAGLFPADRWVKKGNDERLEL